MRDEHSLKKEKLSYQINPINLQSLMSFIRILTNNASNFFLISTDKQF